MMVLEALKICSPLVDLWVPKRNGIDTVSGHQWMRGSSLSAKIEFFFKQPINQGVNAKRRPRWAPDTEPMVEVEAAMALNKKLDARAADFEGFV
jgi:hypothetical protein